MAAGTPSGSCRAPSLDAEAHPMAMSGSASSPVDDATYDLLQTLTSKLEAIELYQQYAEDSDGEVRTLFEDMEQQDRSYTERIVELLRERFGETATTAQG
jgi:hypothetical protein